MNSLRTRLLVGGAAVLILCAAWILRRQNESHYGHGSNISPSDRLAQNAPQSTVKSSSEGQYNNEKQSTSIRSLTSQQIHAHFIRFMGEYGDRVPGYIGRRGVSRFAHEEDFRLREARLLALAYPDIARELALSTIRNSKLRIERAFSCYVLEILAGQGDKVAEAELLQIASSSTDEVASTAFGGLIRADKQGQHKGLYWEKCRDGSIEALRAIARWPDSATLEVMQGVIAANPGIEHPQSGRRLVAQENLKKLEILLAPDRDSRIEAILENPVHPQWQWMEWALDVAKTTKSSTFSQALRKRLDRSVADANRRYEQINRMLAKDNAPPPNQFDLSFATQAQLDDVKDRFLDDVLVAQAELSGPLTDLQKKRLRTFGYACDPKERLAELLAEGR